MVIEEISEIAFSLEPDYISKSYGEHTWCLDASEDVCYYLEEIGIQTRRSSLDGLNLFGPKLLTHAWVELSDGTIIDPTIKQFFLPDKLICKCKQSCQSCRPSLSGPVEDIWILPRNDPRRSLYFYVNHDFTPIGNAHKLNRHPLILD